MNALSAGIETAGIRGVRDGLSARSRVNARAPVRLHTVNAMQPRVPTVLSVLCGWFCGAARLAARLAPCAVIALGALAMPRFSVAAQAEKPPAGGTQTGAPVGTPSSPQTEALATIPLEGTLLGFSMKVPVGTAVLIERGENPNYVLSDTAETPAWRIRISALKATKPGTTAESQCADFLAELKARDAKVKVLADEPRTVSGKKAHIFYASVPLETGGAGMSGTLLVPTDIDSYLAFSIVAVEQGFERTRALLEKSLATISLVDRDAARDERATLLGRGEAIVEAITPEVLRAAVAPEPVFFRMWRPDEKGQPVEIGYLIIRVREGVRSEVNPSRDDSKSTPAKRKEADAQPGLLAAVDARVVVNSDPTHTLDVQSRYFVAWDRSSETWSVVSTQRHRASSRSNAQTGIREPATAGAPRPTLQVISASRDGMTREPKEWDVPPAYLSQAELIVLGQVLPRKEKLQSVEFALYAFDQRDEKLPQRREKWSKTPTGWKLESRIGASPDRLVQEFDNDGRRVRRVDPDGTVTERISLEDLRKLWRAKGLPVD